MLTSLFGALYPRRAADVSDADPDFAVTAMLESPACALDTGGSGPAEPQTLDLIVRGSTSDAVCRSLLPHGPVLDAERALRRVTLFDPGRVWARDIVKLLADASGEPLERVYLRRQDTLSTLALVERTALPRRIAEPLQVAQVEVRSASLRATSVPLALLGRSHLAVVVLGPMASSVLDQLLSLLHDATQRPDWGCPNLLFVLGGTEPETARRIGSIHWPAQLNVEVCTEPLHGASAAWNAVLRGWNRLKLLPQRLSPASVAPVARTGSAAPPRLRLAASRAALGTLQRSPAVQGTATTPLRLDRVLMLRALEALTHVRGMLGAAVVDSTTGLVLGRRITGRACPPDLDQAALTLSEVLKAHRRATLDSQRGHGIEEVLVTQPLALQVLRTLSAQPQLFLFVVLDRAESNLALARHAVAQAEKTLA